MATVMKTLLLTALLVLPQLGAAQIYKSVDAQGNVSYSDTPPASGPSEEIKLRQTNSAPPPPEMAEPQASAPPTSPDGSAATSYTVAVTSPANETTIPMGPGNVAISASVEPALEQGALLQLLVDGTPSGNPQSSNQWQLTNVFRGAHDLSVVVVDPEGERLAESESVRIYVLRPSVNQKNRVKPRPTPH